MKSSLAACALVLALAAPLAAQQRIGSPYLRSIYPPGAKAGGEIELQIFPGEMLEAADRLVFSHPGITAKPVMREANKFYPKPRPTYDRFTVSVASNVPPGVYEVRAGVGTSLSNARKFVVESAEPLRETEENNTPETANETPLGAVVYGQFGRDYDYFKIELARGARVLFDCQAERIDSLADPVLVLSDAEGHELARGQNVAGLDPLIEFAAPADGDYYLCAYDLTFSADAGGAAPYRLRVRAAPWVAFADPPILAPGANRVTLYGHNLGGAPSDVTLGGRTLEKVTTTISAPSDLAQQPTPDELLLRPTSGAVDFLAHRYQAPAGRSNPIPLAVAEVELGREQEPNDALDRPQAVELPCNLLGRFDRSGDIDRYAFEAKKGDKLWVEVVSHQLGLPTAPLAVIRQIERGDDGQVERRDVEVIDRRDRLMDNLPFPLEIADPGELWTAPRDGEYCLLVKDAYGTSEGYFYQLRLRPPRPDFRVLVVPDAELDPRNRNEAIGSRACVVQRGGGVELLLIALRRDGYEGEIDARVEGLPAGVSAAPVTIARGETLGALVIRAAADARPWIGPIKLVAQGQVGEQKLTRRVRPVENQANPPNNMVAPARLTATLTLAVDASSVAPARVEQVHPQVWRTARGGKLEIPVRLVKQNDKFNGSVSLRPVGLPERVRRQDVTVSTGGEAKYVMNVDVNAEAGRFTILLRGPANVQQRRHEDLAKRAKEAQERITKLFQESEKTLREATQARSQAEQEARQMVQARDNARRAMDAAKQAAAKADGEAKQLAAAAEQKRKVAREAAGRAKDLLAVAAKASEGTKQAAQKAADEAKQQAEQRESEADAARKQADEAAARAKKSAEQLTEATNALTEAEKQVEQSEKAKKLAIAAEQQAKTDREAADQARREAEQERRRWEQIARPRTVRVPIYSDPIAIEVAEYPLALKLGAPRYTVTAGETVELVVELKRDFGFEGDVQLRLDPPSGVGGLRFEPTDRIAKNQSRAGLKLATDRNTKPGEHTIELIARFNYNGRNIDMPTTFELQVEPPKEEKK